MLRPIWLHVIKEVNMAGKIRFDAISDILFKKLKICLSLGPKKLIEGRSNEWKDVKRDFLWSLLSPLN